MSATNGLRLYNTLTRDKAVFEPIDRDNVRMYVCGPTVYDYAHIGNARPAIVFDVLFRLLRHVYGAEHVTYARNITDVDDKINARAVRDFPNLPLNDAIRQVTEKTAKQYFHDTAELGCLDPTIQPRATDNITEMQTIISSLISRQHAYAAAGEVLFDVNSMPDYGKLSGRNLDEQQAGARVAVDAHKKSPGDFVLWKLSSDNEPGWESPWGRGRPGWHIECSAMSHRYLGETFDIHGGGLDLIFPHHENEIAQSRCAHGTKNMANVWMHNGFVQIEGRKMSKSDGNFVTIHDLLHTEDFGGRKWPGEVLRLAMLMTHYRQPIDFSLKRLEEAQGIVRRWADAKVRIVALLAESSEVPAWTLPQDSPVLDDLNLYPVITGINQLASDAVKGDSDAASAFLGLLDLMGFEAIEHLSQQATDLDLSLADEDKWAGVTQRIEARLALLKARNFTDADRIRDELLAEGIQLKDGKDAGTGERVTTWEVKR
ncbi:MAG: cysteine--tRNA ligase [Pararhizobium sp.]